MKTKRLGMFFGIGLAMTAATAIAHDPSIFAHDKQFVHDYSATVLAIQRVAQMEEVQGQDSQVKGLAQQIFQDYAAVNQEMNTISRQIGQTPQIAEEANVKITKLTGLTGETFDLTALRDLLEFQTKAENETGLELANGIDLTIRQIAVIFEAELQVDLQNTLQLDNQLNGHLSISMN